MFSVKTTASSTMAARARNEARHDHRIEGRPVIESTSAAVNRENGMPTRPPTRPLLEEKGAEPSASS
jgi:hypothetical protein